MMQRSVLGLALAALFTSAPALAAQRPDLALTLTPPSSQHVYENARYTYNIANVGNKNANGVVLTIQLPMTNTTAVQIMGTPSALDNNCSISGTRIVCQVGTVNKGTSTNRGFDIVLPYSANPLTFSASVSTTTPGEINLGNNTSNHTASLLTYDVTVSPPETAINRHCTGTNLSSFYECELYPSSISSHTTSLDPGGSISFVGAPPSYTGLWWMPSTDHLQFQYFDTGTLVAEFDGYGVGGDCFEGVTTFPGSSYMSMYEVCLQ
jgi:hypothetical protein